MSVAFQQEGHGKAILPVVGDLHCGKDDGLLHLSYDIYLSYSDKALDNQGFLLDNLTFEQYFKTLSDSTISISCEVLCTQVCRDFVQMLGDRSQYLHSIKVCLSPFDGVQVSAESSGPFYYRSPLTSHSMIHPEVDYANTLPDDFLSHMVADDDGWTPRDMGDSYGYI